MNEELPVFVKRWFTMPAGRSLCDATRLPPKLPYMSVSTARPRRRGAARRRPWGRGPRLAPHSRHRTPLAGSSATLRAAVNTGSSNA
ncbi:hypothetical protein GCM10010466_01100 [Planomonospora alba]|uniref:Uncharacterized protein n=1 Tax=Planomonospora alba TaxID=161354 RepID=A0ABP6MH96_9ACTN